MIRRSARLRKIDAHVVQEFPNFNSDYFGSVPGYVDEEDKAKIDKIFLDYKNSHCEDFYEDDTSIEIPSIEQIIHQAFVSEEYSVPREIPKPPNYEDHPHYTPGNKQLGNQIKKSIDGVLSQIGTLR